MLVFLEFEGSDIDRSEFRRMVKRLRKNKVFSHSEGKTIYFELKQQENVRFFLLNLNEILKSEGLLTEIFLNDDDNKN